MQKNQESKIVYERQVVEEYSSISDNLAANYTQLRMVMGLIDKSCYANAVILAGLSPERGMEKTQAVSLANQLARGVVQNIGNLRDVFTNYRLPIPESIEHRITERETMAKRVIERLKV